MSSESLLLEGFELMLIGMGLVFLFLVMLIACIRLMSVLLQRYAAPDIAVATATPAAHKPSAGPLPDADTLAAIQAAIRQHRAQ